MVIPKTQTSGLFFFSIHHPTSSVVKESSSPPTTETKEANSPYPLPLPSSQNTRPNKCSYPGIWVLSEWRKNDGQNSLTRGATVAVSCHVRVSKHFLIKDSCGDSCFLGLSCLGLCWFSEPDSPVQLWFCEPITRLYKVRDTPKKGGLTLAKNSNRRFTTSSFCFLCVYLIFKTYEFPFHLWFLYSWHNAKESLRMWAPFSFRDMIPCVCKRHILRWGVAPACRK